MNRDMTRGEYVFCTPLFNNKIFNSGVFSHGLYSINIGDLKNRAVLLLGMQQNQNCIGNGLKSSIF